MGRGCAITGADDEAKSAGIARRQHLRIEAAMPAPNIPEIPADKVIVFQLQGGPRDGEVDRSDDQQARNRAIQNWILTGGGLVGRQFAGMSPRVEEFMLRPHKSPEAFQEAYREAGGPFQA